MITITQMPEHPTEPSHLPVCMFCQQTEDRHVPRLIFLLRGEAGFGISACNKCLIELRDILSPPAFKNPEQEKLLNQEFHNAVMPRRSGRYPWGED